MFENKDMFVFDEFTSVVDRNIACIGSRAMQKAIRRADKKFIAVTCHYDVEDWLLPDWVFNTDTMTFTAYSADDLKKKKKHRIAVLRSQRNKRERTLLEDV
jgi:ABC-type ATPase with predicted acetyltransferase domain